MEIFQPTGEEAIPDVASVSNTDGTLTISPTTGSVIVSRPAITGDISIPVASNVATLTSVNSSIGTFNNVTLNVKGLATAGTNVAYLTGNQTITLSNDVSGSGTTSISVTLASIILAGGPIGSATVTPIITYDAKGRLTTVTSATITPAASSITGGAALTKVDDTNVTLTLGGTPASALLAASSLTLGWTGTLSTARGGTGNGTGTATINANLTGPITSVGNATSIASQTGTGTKFVVDNSPTLITPVLGVASATSLNKLTITTPATGSTLTIIDGKTLTINKTISFTAADDTGVYTLPTGTKTLVDTTVTTLSSLALPESQLTFTDITTNNASTTKHGFLLKLSNTATQYMNGTGAWSTPPDTTYTGTTNQVVVTGTVLSLPQSINTTASVQFSGIGLGAASPAGTSGFGLASVGDSVVIQGEATAGSTGSLLISQNASLKASTWTYINTAKATNYYQNVGTHAWRYAASGTAGNTITWSTAMTIDNSGNVGIGTSTGVAKFMVKPATDQNFKIGGNLNLGDGILINSANDADSVNKGIEFRASAFLMSAGDLTVGIGGTGTAIRQIIISGDNGAAGGAQLTFKSNGTATGAIGSENVIEGSGSNTKLDFYASGNAFRFHALGAGTMTTDASGNVVIVSDERLKDIQGDFKAGLKEVLNLNPILYKWNEKSGNETKETYAGFSAQNVKEFIPEAVGESDGYLSLQDRGIMAALVNGMKEQQKMIEDLKTEIKELKKCPN